MTSNKEDLMAKAESHPEIILDGDTSTDGSTSSESLLTYDGLNANAPAFTSNSSVAPVILTKNLEIGNERWKPNASIVEESCIPIAEMPQPFIGSDGLYYIPTELVNNFSQPVVLEQISTDSNGQQEAYVSEVQETSPKDLPVDELKRLIQLQFEYYFSRENLANDSYLVSQMDSDSYVYIATVAKFNQVRKLTSDMNVIIQALKESPYVQLDETEQKVRANMKRCIVILREIPESTPVQEVKALFEHPNCPKWSSFEFAHNDSWYVTFECEEEAKQAYRHLREEVQNFKGRPLMARIKAKTLLSRTVYLPKNSNNTASQTDPQPPHYTVAPQAPAFSIPPNAVFHSGQEFQFYTSSVNGAPLLPGTWIGPRHQLIQEIRPNKHSFAKHSGYPMKSLNGQRPYYNGGKPHFTFRGSGYSSTKVVERNGILDSDERNLLSRRSYGVMNGHPGGFRRDDARFTRSVPTSVTKRDSRGNLEESPRFQRLRERRTKEEQTTTITQKQADNSLNCSSDLTLDLAPENFPALPSPNSPNESNVTVSTTSSLKELATNALQLAQDNLSLECSPVSSSDLSDPSPIEHSSSDNDVILTSALSTAKISYAQMAQKPQNKAFEGDDKDFDSMPDTKSCTKTENKVATSTPRSPHRRGSPRTPRSKNAQEKNKLDLSTDNNELAANTKDTYASKFGKSAPTKAQQSQRTKTRPVAQNLPPPRPLMSQIIKPPDSKLQEISAQKSFHEQSSPPPQKSFSETVKNLNDNTSAKESEIDNKENVQNN